MGKNKQLSKRVKKRADLQYNKNILVISIIGLESQLISTKLNLEKISEVFIGCPYDELVHRIKKD